MASGSLVTKAAKGFREFSSVGLVDREAIPALYGAQAAGCDPIARGFAHGADDITPVKPNTIAKSLAIGNPADGYYALQDARTTGGAVVSVPESQSADGIRLLAATEGLFTETAGGVTVAGLEQLVAAGTISPERETVVVITGTGLKTLEALDSSVRAHAVEPRIETVLERIQGGGE